MLRRRLRPGRQSVSPERFAAAFSGRLAALAKAHTLLANDRWTGAKLHELIREQLAAHCAADDAIVTIQGDDVALEPSAALALGLTLHELATNAAKHGALASPAGSIEIGAQVGAGSDGRRLTLTWRERGGPPIRARPRRGFGLMLIEQGLSYQLQGRVALNFRRAGLHCTIDLPVAGGAVRGGAGGWPGEHQLAGQTR
jgi:two-component sensor histidine kinase